MADGINPLASAAIGVIAGILGYLSSRLIEKVLLAPNLKISFANSPAFIASHNAWSQEHGNQSDTTLRLMLSNDSIHVAKGCRVFLSRIEVPSDSGVVEIGYHDALQLRWAYEGTGHGVKTVDLPKGVGFYFDVIRAFWERHEDGFTYPVVSLMTAIQPDCYRELLKAGRDYILTIVATAENAEPYEFSIRLVPHVHSFKVSEHSGNSRSEFRRLLDDYRQFGR